MTRNLWLFVLLAGCAAPEFRAGAGIADITPPVGRRMSGYFHERLSTGTKDPLTARAVVFTQGGVKAALVFCDLVGIPREVADRARARAAARTGIPADHICVAATHSHTGPLFYGPLHRLFKRRHGAGEDPGANDDYPERLAAGVADAVARALENARPGPVSAGTAGQDPPLSFNRRFHMKNGTVRFNPGQQNPDIVHPAGPIDPDVGVVRLPGAVLTVFALHLDTTGGTEYSADYPRYLHETLGPGTISVFGTGPCGDINHVDVTIKGRRSAREIGTMLGRTVKTARTRPVAPSLAVGREIVRVPRQTVTPERLERAKRDADGVGTRKLPFLAQVETCTVLDLPHLPEVLPLEVQAFRISPDLAIVTLPGEVFVDLGLAIKRASPFRTTLVVELANDNPAYVPTRKAFTEGSYETVNSRILPGGGEALVAAAVRLLKQLAPGD